MQLKTATEEIPEYHGNLNHKCVFPVLGKYVQFSSNLRAAIDSVNSILKHWEKLPVELCDSNSCYKVDIVILEPDCNTAPAAYKFKYERIGNKRIARHGENIHVVDSPAGRALAYVTQDLFSDELAFAWFVVESLALSLAASSHRVPFHASAVSKDDHAFAFIGNSGSGKSTLAYACIKRGFKLLAEDVIYVGTEADYRIWGNSTKIKLLPDSINLFSELDSLERKLHPNGEFKISVPLNDIDDCSAQLQVKSITPCLVEPAHHNPASSLKKIPPERVFQYIKSSGEPMYDLYADELSIAMDHLLGREAYNLRVGRDLNGTIDLLMNLK